MLTSCKNFIANENASCVGVFLEFVQDGLECGKLCLVPCRRVLKDMVSLGTQFTHWANLQYLVDLGVKGVQIHEQVDASLVKCTHTAAMVTGGVHMVYSNGIGSELLHGSGISSALSLVEQWVERDKLISDSRKLSRVCSLPLLPEQG